MQSPRRSERSRGWRPFDPTASFASMAGPIFQNLILADEINRTPPKTQAALLQAMQERCVMRWAVRRTRSPIPFRCSPPGRNPIEQEGTYPLPEAQLDRFLLEIHVDYPSEAGGTRRDCASHHLWTTARTNSKARRGRGRAPRSFGELRAADPDHGRSRWAGRRCRPACSPDLAPERRRRTGRESGRYRSRFGAGPRGESGARPLREGSRSIPSRGAAAADVEDVAAMVLPALRHRLVLGYRAGGATACKDVDIVGADPPESRSPTKVVCAPSMAQMDRESLKSDLKRLVIEELDLRDHTETTIDDDAPLFGEGLGLDSPRRAPARRRRRKSGSAFEIPEDDSAKVDLRVRLRARAVHRWRAALGMTGGRIAVTGIGLVSALGAGATNTFERLVRGERAFSEISLFDVTEGQRTNLGQREFPAFDRPTSRPARGSLVSFRTRLHSLRRAKRWSDAGILFALASVRAFGSGIRGGCVADVARACSRRESLLVGLARTRGCQRGRRSGSCLTRSAAPRRGSPRRSARRIVSRRFAAHVRAARTRSWKPWRGSVPERSTSRSVGWNGRAASQLTLTGFNARSARTQTSKALSSASIAHAADGLTSGEGSRQVSLARIRGESARSRRVAQCSRVAFRAGRSASEAFHRDPCSDPNLRRGCRRVLLPYRDPLTRGLAPPEAYRPTSTAHGTGTVLDDAVETAGHSPRRVRRAREKGARLLPRRANSA